MNVTYILQLKVVHSAMPIKSIELQLIRVETCGCAEGYARDGMRQVHVNITQTQVLYNVCFVLSV